MFAEACPVPGSEALLQGCEGQVNGETNYESLKVA